MAPLPGPRASPATSIHEISSIYFPATQCGSHWQLNLPRMLLPRWSSRSPLPSKASSHQTKAPSSVAPVASLSRIGAPAYRSLPPAPDGKGLGRMTEQVAGASSGGKPPRERSRSLIDAPQSSWAKRARTARLDAGCAKCLRGRDRRLLSACAICSGLASPTPGSPASLAVASATSDSHNYEVFAQ